MTTPQDDMAKLVERLNQEAFLKRANEPHGRFLEDEAATAIRSLTEENKLLKADFHDTTDIYEALGIAGNESPVDAIRALTEERDVFMNCYVAISQVVGRQGSEDHTLVDDVKRVVAERDALTARVGELEAKLAVMNAVSKHQTNRAFEPVEGIPQHVHPLTCGNDSNHTPLYPFWDGKKVQLICRDCDYTQDNSGPVT